MCALFIPENLRAVAVRLMASAVIALGVRSLTFLTRPEPSGPTRLPERVKIRFLTNSILV